MDDTLLAIRITFLKSLSEAKSHYRKGDLEIRSTAIRKMGEIDRTANKVVTGAGSTGFVTTPFCELENIKLVPMEYHEVDMVKINKLMKAGVKVKGIRYWTEERPRSGR